MKDLSQYITPMDAAGAITAGVVAYIKNRADTGEENQQQPTSNVPQKPSGVDPTVNSPQSSLSNIDWMKENMSGDLGLQTAQNTSVNGFSLAKISVGRSETYDHIIRDGLEDAAKSAGINFWDAKVTSEYIMDFAQEHNLSLLAARKIANTLGSRGYRYLFGIVEQSIEGISADDFLLAAARTAGVL